MKRFILNKVMCGLSAAIITMANGASLALAGQPGNFFTHAAPGQGAASFASQSLGGIRMASAPQQNLVLQQQSQAKFISGHQNLNSGNANAIVRNNGQIPGAVISRTAKSAMADKAMAIKSTKLTELNNKNLIAKTFPVNHPAKITSNKIASKSNVNKLNEVVDLNKLTSDKSNTIKNMTKLEAGKLVGVNTGKVTLYGKPTDSTNDPNDNDPPDPGANNATATDTPTTGTGIAYDTPTTYGHLPIKSNIDFSKMKPIANLAALFPSTDPKPGVGPATDEHHYGPAPTPSQPVPGLDGDGPHNHPATDWQTWVSVFMPIFGGLGGYSGDCGTWTAGYNCYPDAGINAVSNVADDVVEQAAPEAIPESTTTVKIAIVNPEDTGVTFKFRLNDETKSLPEGNRMELTDSAGQIIEFNRGKSLGLARYALNEGQYTLKATDKGWELFHSEFTPPEEQNK